MAATANSDPKSNDFNAYADVASADAFFETRLGAGAWDAADEDTKNRALITATAFLDRSTWVGYRTESDQKLDWPRTGMEDEEGYALAEEAIPNKIFEATCLTGLWLLGAGDGATLGEPGPAVKREKLGELETEYFGRDSDAEGGLPDSVSSLISEFVDTPPESGGLVIARVVRS